MAENSIVIFVKVGSLLWEADIRKVQYNANQCNAMQYMFPIYIKEIEVAIALLQRGSIKERHLHIGVYT